MSESRVPLVDLRIQTEQIEVEVEAGLARVFERSNFVLGEEVAEFERDFAAFSGVPHCLGVGNGTDALELALRAVGVGPGAEVIVPANSFVASAMAVVRAGATPVLVDADPVTLLLDADAVAAAVTPATKAVMPVHLYGQVAPMQPLLDLAGASGIAVVEDAAQAQGARQDGRPACSFGAVAATSFYPGKNLGAFGDGGAVLTASDGVAERVAALRNYGGTVKYEHPEIGFNSRLDTVQAVVLAAKLRRLAGWNEERREAAARYSELLSGDERVVVPATADGNEHIWHLYVVRVAERDRVLARMKEAGVDAGIHYPVPIHLQGAFFGLGYQPGDLPVSEAAAATVLSLPIFPGITAHQQERVAAALLAALAG